MDQGAIAPALNPTRKDTSLSLHPSTWRAFLPPRPLTISWRPTVRRLDAVSASALDPIRRLSRRPEPNDQRERRTPWNPDRTGDFASPFLDLPIEQGAFRPLATLTNPRAVWKPRQRFDAGRRSGGYRAALNPLVGPGAMPLHRHRTMHERLAVRSPIRRTVRSPRWQHSKNTASKNPLLNRVP